MVNRAIALDAKRRRTRIDLSKSVANRPRNVNILQRVLTVLCNLNHFIQKRTLCRELLGALQILLLLFKASNLFVRAHIDIEVAHHNHAQLATIDTFMLSLEVTHKRAHFRKLLHTLFPAPIRLQMRSEYEAVSLLKPHPNE